MNELCKTCGHHSLAHSQNKCYAPGCGCTLFVEPILTQDVIKVLERPMLHGERREVSGLPGPVLGDGSLIAWCARHASS